MNFVELDKDKARFAQVAIDGAAGFAVSEIANTYNVSRNAVLATAIHEWLVMKAEGGLGGDKLNFFAQKMRRIEREDAMQEAIAIATELNEHPDTEQQTEALERICKTYGFDIEKVIERGKVANESAEYVRKLVKREPDEREAFLIELLMRYGRPMPVTEVEAAWKDAGFPPTTLHRIKRGIQIESVRLSTEWGWQLK